MDYHIAEQNGEKIASFEYEPDRDVCIRALRELYTDVGEDYFNAVDEEEEEEE